MDLPPSIFKTENPNKSGTLQDSGIFTLSAFGNKSIPGNMLPVII